MTGVGAQEYPRGSRHYVECEDEDQSLCSSLDCACLNPQTTVCDAGGQLRFFRRFHSTDGGNILIERGRVSFNKIGSRFFSVYSYDVNRFGGPAYIQLSFGKAPERVRPGLAALPSHKDLMEHETNEDGSDLDQPAFSTSSDSVSAVCPFMTGGSGQNGATTKRDRYMVP